MLTEIKFLFWGDVNVLKLVVMVAQLHEYTKNHSIVLFIRMNLIVLELYLNKTVIRTQGYLKRYVKMK